MERKSYEEREKEIKVAILNEIKANLGGEYNNF